MCEILTLAGSFDTSATLESVLFTSDGRMILGLELT